MGETNRGRPVSLKAPFFQHENHLRDHRVMKSLRAQFGLEGYAICMMIMELLCDSDLIMVKYDEYEIEMMAGDFMIDSGRLREIVEHLIKIRWLIHTHGQLICPYLDDKFKRLFSKRHTPLDQQRGFTAIDLPEKPITGNVIGENGGFSAEDPPIIDHKRLENTSSMQEVNDDEVISFLKKEGGIKPASKATELVAEFGAVMCLDWALAVLYLKRQGKRKGGGYLASAIREGYAWPDGYVRLEDQWAAKIRAAENKALEDERAAEAARVEELEQAEAARRESIWLGLEPGKRGALTGEILKVMESKPGYGIAWQAYQKGLKAKKELHQMGIIFTACFNTLRDELLSKRGLL